MRGRRNRFPITPVFKSTVQPDRLRFGSHDREVREENHYAQHRHGLGVTKNCINGESKTHFSILNQWAVCLCPYLTEARSLRTSL
jgi:hypothetical protein